MLKKDMELKLQEQEKMIKDLTDKLNNLSQKANEKVVKVKDFTVSEETFKTFIQESPALAQFFNKNKELTHTELKNASNSTTETKDSKEKTSTKEKKTLQWHIENASNVLSIDKKVVNAIVWAISKKKTKKSLEQYKTYCTNNNRADSLKVLNYYENNNLKTFFKKA